MSKKKKVKVFFDEKYLVRLEGVSDEDRRFIARIEGVVVEETEKQFKIKTMNFWGAHYGISYVKLPKNSTARDTMNRVYADKYYWLNKDRVTILKDTEAETK